MYSKTAAQPENLSAPEWVLLQHLSTCSAPFYLQDVLLHFADTTEVVKGNKSLLFYQQFSRLKSAGYLVIVPVASISITPETRPLYNLTALGRTAIQRYN